ncbi:MAG: hypothetical protein Ta2A_16580 [Treponemataceae bacterium]|nr:MAG: hypothetical protein Ta2A_16580 [Treponemataceae bacterium]
MISAFLYLHPYPIIVFVRVVREVDFSTLWVEKWLNLELLISIIQQGIYE